MSPHRKTVIPQDEVGYYRTYNRCVHGASLCSGQNSATSFRDSRKEWIRSHLAHLCRGFAVEVCDFSILDTDFHLILRNRPDLVPYYSDEEAALRWWLLRPIKNEAPRDEATLADLRPWLDDENQMKRIRTRLSDISYFMKIFSEYVALRANREEGQRGCFFEGNFKATRLVDEASLLACSIYVNLSPIQAGTAERPVISRYVSVFERLQALQAWYTRSPKKTAVDLSQLTDHQELCIESSLFVCPLRIATSWELAPIVQHNTFPARRASNRGILALGLTDYLQLLEWTGRQLCQDHRNEMPSELAAIMHRFGIRGEHWVDIFGKMPDLLRSAARRSRCLNKRAERAGRQAVRSIGLSRELF